MMIETQRFPLILNRKSTDKALVCLYEEIYFICVTYLFDLELYICKGSVHPNVHPSAPGWEVM